MFIFSNKEEAFSYDRSGFANRVCKLIYNQSNNDIDKAIDNGKNIFKDFSINVRNIYELIDEYIPLIAYYELIQNGADNYDLNDEEYKHALDNCKAACFDYYA